MKRSTPLARKTPLKSSGFKRKSPFTNTADRATAEMRVEKRLRATKRKSGEDKRMRDACRDEPCYLRIPGVCTSNPKTSVPAHRNEGKGMGMKTPDVFTVPGCPTCHHEYDQGKRFLREHKRALWNAAYARWEPARAVKLGLKEEEGALLDSNTEPHRVAHATRAQREAVRNGAVPADAGARNDGVSACASASAEHDEAVCLG
ncbi:gp74 [Caballeronia novacaledonica]|uniref:Gp74 n=1 Tax=Caballeronia novacaledonica TaxID=1544861 RepID=A0A2U3I8I2_9BURK|nr:nuclease domain-containing protein [Caballeronia novacaledonica]SPB16509.1 gp74 [Caballeronia novacaledonica]